MSYNVYYHMKYQPKCWHLGLRIGNCFEQVVVMVIFGTSSTNMDCTLVTAGPSFLQYVAVLETVRYKPAWLWITVWTLQSFVNVFDGSSAVLCSLPRGYVLQPLIRCVWEKVMNDVWMAMSGCSVSVYIMHYKFLAGFLTSMFMAWTVLNKLSCRGIRKNHDSETWIVIYVLWNVTSKSHVLD